MAQTARIGDEARAKIERAWPDLMDALESGAMLGPIYERHGVSLRAVRVYRGENPAAEAEWQRAREQGADAYADQVIEIANNPGNDPAGARVRMDALRWLAAKRNPRVYSDKAQLDVNVRTVDLGRIIADASARLAAAREPRLVGAGRAGAPGADALPAARGEGAGAGGRDEPGAPAAGMVELAIAQKIAELL